MTLDLALVSPPVRAGRDGAAERDEVGVGLVAAPPDEGALSGDAQRVGVGHGALHEPEVVGEPSAGGEADLGRIRRDVVPVRHRDLVLCPSSAGLSIRMSRGFFGGSTHGVQALVLDG